MGSKPLPPEVVTALREAVVDGLTVRFAGQLDRATFVAAAKVLTDLGGRYRTGRAAGYVFEHDPAPGLARVLAGGPVTDRVAEGFVETPDGIAARLCALAGVAGLPPGSRVLEPSAGRGAIVRAVHRANPGVVVTAVEPNPGRADLIPSQTPGAIQLYRTTFEAFATYREWFSAVVMNPPFSTPEDRALWIGHVELAWGMLSPGGCLAAVVPAGLGYRSDSDRRHQRVRDLVDEFGECAALPDDAFGGIRTMALLLVRP